MHAVSSLPGGVPEKFLAVEEKVMHTDAILQCGRLTHDGS